jgi:hypothetical protein
MQNAGEKVPMLTPGEGSKLVGVDLAGARLAYQLAQAPVQGQRPFAPFPVPDCPD